MKKYLNYILFLLAISFCGSCNSQTKRMKSIDGQYLVEDYIKKWKANKRYTLKVLEAMPEADYDFKPADGMKTFKSQATHIASWLNNHIKKVGLTGLTKVDASSKKSLMASLEKNFDELLTYIETIDANKLGENTRMWYGQSTRSRLMNLMDNHLAHHRGQMIVYLRLKGIRAPSYVGW